MKRVFLSQFCLSCWLFLPLFEVYSTKTQRSLGSFSQGLFTQPRFLEGWDEESLFEFFWFEQRKPRKHPFVNSECP